MTQIQYLFLGGICIITSLASQELEPMQTPPPAQSESFDSGLEEEPDSIESPEDIEDLEDSEDPEEMGSTEIQSTEEELIKEQDPVIVDQQVVFHQESMQRFGYNAPSRTAVGRAWDVFTTGSFIYWQPSEDNIELGQTVNTHSTVLPMLGTMFNMHFGYKPGFKVGMGINFDHDDWTLYTEYMWLRSKDRQSVSTTGLSVDSLSILSYSYWQYPLRSGANLDEIQGTWHVNFKWLDFVLQRAYYLGTQWTLTPYFGGRATWIDQKYSVFAISHRSGVNYTTYQKSHSWGVGLATGGHVNCLLGYGIRLYGKSAMDLLYTQYSRQIYIPYSINNGFVPDVDMHQYGLVTLRPHAELDMGLGWERYFDRNRWHIDLSAGYDFHIFWTQNMFLQFTDNNSPTQVARGGDLYLQGLTTSIRLDF